MRIGSSAGGQQPMVSDAPSRPWPVLPTVELRPTPACRTRGHGNESSVLRVTFLRANLSRSRCVRSVMKPRDRLDSLQIVTPCSVPWSSMNGDDAVRFCDRCRKNVYNVAAMTPDEAVDII